MLVGRGTAWGVSIGGTLGYWTDLLNATYDANLTVTATATPGFWDGSAFSTGSFVTDGYVEFIANQTGTTRMFGISRIDQIFPDYALYAHSSGTLYKNNAVLALTTPIGTWTSGDVLRLDRVGSTITYYKNGASQSTDPGSLTDEMHANCAFYGPGKVEFPTMGNL